MKLPLEILGLALAYFVTGKLGLLLAIAPGYATAIWLPSGIALACLLQFGNRLWPGVLLGSLAVNLSLGLDTASAASMARSLAIAASIGLGASLQAWAGAWLIRRYVGFPHALTEAGDVLRFTLLGGPLASLVNASIGATTLLAAGAVQGADYLAQWFTWWTGDTLGVLVVGPLLLAFVGQPRQAWRPRRWTVALPLAGLFLASITIHVWVSGLEQQRLEREFQQRAGAIERAIEDRLESYVGLLHGVRDYVAVAHSLERDEFHQMAGKAMKRAEGMTGIGWVPRVAAAERASHEESARKDGLGGFVFSDIGPGGKLQPAPSRALYYPIYFAVPKEREQAAAGIDLGAIPERLATLEHARDSALPSASEAGQVFLLDGASTEPGIRVVLPVYRGAAAPESQDQRRLALRGFVVGVFSLKAVLATAWPKEERSGIDLRIEDRSTAGPSRLLFADAAPAPGAAFAWTHALRFAARDWSLQFSSNLAYRPVQQSVGAWAVLSFALMWVGLIGAFLLMMTGRTAGLEAQSRRLASIIESTSDAVSTTGRDGQLVYLNPAGRRQFGIGADEDIGRFANKQFASPEALAHIAQVALPAALRDGHWSGESELHSRDGRKMVMSRVLLAHRNAAGEPELFTNIMRDITERKQSEQALQAALLEKVTLLREIHHRVKNNLQVVASLLSLQQRQLGPGELGQALAESRGRVESIAMVHEMLYGAQNLAQVEFGGYARRLAEQIGRVMAAPQRGIAIQIDADATALGIDQAVPCALILNELLTNAFKHAFPDGRAGTITIRLRGAPDGQVLLELRDDGVGLPESAGVERSATLGFDLVGILAGQIGGQIEIERRDGTLVRLRFRMAAPSQT